MEFPFLWTLAAAFAALTALAAWADHRRGRRRDLDRPGWVPWHGAVLALDGERVAWRWGSGLGG